MQEACTRLQQLDLPRRADRLRPRLSRSVLCQPLLPQVPRGVAGELSPADQAGACAQRAVARCVAEGSYYGSIGICPTIRPDHCRLLVLPHAEICPTAKIAPAVAMLFARIREITSGVNMTIPDLASTAWCWYQLCSEPSAAPLRTQPGPSRTSGPRSGERARGIFRTPQRASRASEDLPSNSER